MRAEFYAVYRGDEVVCVGKLHEVCKMLGIKVNHLKWLASPACHRRDKGGRLVAYRFWLDDDE